MHPRTGRLSKSTPVSSAPACQRGSSFSASASHAYFRTRIPATTPAVVVHMLSLVVAMECRASAKRHSKLRLSVFPGLDEAVGKPSEVCPMIKPYRLVRQASGVEHLSSISKSRADALDVSKTRTPRCTLRNQSQVPTQSPRMTKTIWRFSRLSVLRRRSHARFSKPIGTKP